MYRLSDPADNPPSGWFGTLWHVDLRLDKGKYLLAIGIAVILVAVTIGAKGGNGPPIPHWLAVRVHALVQNDQAQDGKIAQLQADVKALQDQVATLQTTVQTHVACEREVPVSLARVRALTGHNRYVLRLPQGAAPRYFLVADRRSCA